MRFVIRFILSTIRKTDVTRIVERCSENIVLIVFKIDTILALKKIECQYRLRMALLHREGVKCKIYPAPTKP